MRSLNLSPVGIGYRGGEVEQRAAGVGGTSDARGLELATANGVPAGLEQTVTKVVGESTSVANGTSVLRLVNVTEVV